MKRTPKSLAKQITNWSGVTYEQLFGKVTVEEIARSQRLFCVLLMKHLDWSPNVIGRFLGISAFMVSSHIDKFYDELLAEFGDE